MTPAELVANARTAVQESYQGGSRDAEKVALVVIREVLAALTDATFADECRDHVIDELRTAIGTAVTLKKILRE